MKTMLDFYCYLGDKFLGYRGYMGSNLDALDDMLIEISEESIRKTKIYLFDFDSFNKK
ncbi:barstar family protein [Tenacibaculum halocynthiae]|uniref:barstar family protein n=1 Tax=Tenacibaculum halocynthiae TaxID=1254437 RepID=UPI003893BC38